MTSNQKAKKNGMPYEIASIATRNSAVSLPIRLFIAGGKHVFQKLAVFAVMAAFYAVPVAALADVRLNDDQIVERREQRLLVTFKDGAKEYYVVAYSARLKRFLEQRGEASKLLKGKIVDTRECRWQFNGYVQRQVFLVTRSGQRFEHTTIRRLHDVARSGVSDGPTILRWHKETCGDARRLWGRDMEIVRTELIRKLSDAVRNDMDAVKRDVGATVQEVIEQR